MSKQYNSSYRYDGAEESTTKRVDSVSLHGIFGSSFVTLDQALLMIHHYPLKLQCRDANGDLPIHLECKNQCRSSIIAKCIELYPESFAIANENFRELPLHRFIENELSSIDDALMMMKAYPAALKHQNSIGCLPLHLECEYRCRSLIISKCIELHDEALDKADKEGYLPLHRLLENASSSSIEDALMMIEKYPAALQLQTSEYGHLPIHIECQGQCRSSVVLRCTELYPEALRMPNMWGNLPLHSALSNSAATIDVALMILNKYPEALRCGDAWNSLPIHAECYGQCRVPIILKCIELYPESLAIVDKNSCLPIHALLYKSSSPVDVALLMIKQYQTALHVVGKQGYLPIHIECDNQCRSSVISKCVERYPESASISNDDGDIPWSLALEKLTVDNICELRSSLTALLTSYHASFYHPPDDPLIDKHEVMQDPGCRRIILNLLPSCLSSAAHVQAYHDVNWQPRSSLLHLWLQIRMRNNHTGAALLAELLHNTEPSHEISIKNQSMRLLMMKMIGGLSLLSMDADVADDLRLGDGISDSIIRVILAYI
jgi:hypothetical protein